MIPEYALQHAADFRISKNKKRPGSPDLFQYKLIIL